MNQTQVIKREILDMINSGATDKVFIYSKVVEKLHVQRPTVRRCASSLIQDLENTLKVLK